MHANSDGADYVVILSHLGTQAPKRDGLHEMSSPTLKALGVVLGRSRTALSPVNKLKTKQVKMYY